MERNCQICIHHISGLCSKWECEMQTLEDYRDKVIDEFVKLADECSGYTANCIEHDLALTIYTIHQIAEQMKRE